MGAEQKLSNLSSTSASHPKQSIEGRRVASHAQTALA